MKRSLLLVVLCVCLASPVYGSVFLRWDTCFQEGGLDNARCDGTHALNITYGIDAAVPGASIVTGAVTWGGLHYPLPSFWHFEPGGCNAGGVTIDDSRNNTGCSARATFNGVDGSHTDAFLEFQEGVPNGNDVRMLWTLARDTTLVMAAHPQYFACRLIVAVDAATEFGGSCEGCSHATDDVVLDWIRIEGAESGGQRPVLKTLSATDPGSYPQVCWNCMPTPARETSWSRLKSLYR